MGILFQNIDDIKVLKSLFKGWDIDEAKDVYGNGKQAGTAYYLNNKTYLLVPIHSKHIIKTIAEDREADCIAWDVHVSYWVPSHDRMQPDDIEDKELLLDASFEDAVAAINTDMFRCEVMNCLENFDYENEDKEKTCAKCLNPYE